MEHPSMTDTVTLASLEHVAHCPECYARFHIGDRATYAMDLVTDLVHEFQKGATVVWNTKDSE